MDKWIAKFTVVPLSRSREELDGIAGAFVHVVGLAESPENYLKLAEESLSEAGFKVEAVEDVELLADRLRHGSISKKLLESALGLGDTEMIVFSDFHAWGH